MNNSQSCMMEAICFICAMAVCRKMESEADAIGLSLAAQACYNPQAAVQVFQKFDQMEKEHGTARIPGFLRTHPMNSARIEAIRKKLPPAQQLFQSSGCQQRQSIFRSVAVLHSADPFL